MTTLNLGTLVVTLEAESGKYKAELRGAGDAAKQMERTATQATKSTENSLKNLRKGFQQTAQAMGAVSAGLGLAWKTLGQAAELQRVEQRFEAAAQSIGTNARSLMESLEATGGGMMASSEMMAGALTLIDTGLADSADETIRLQRLVSELNWDMQALTLTMLNDSKMRLDTLRLSAERVEELEQKYLAMGMAHEEAFDMAVIEAGEEKLALYGSAVNSMEGDLRRMAATAKDAADALLNVVSAGAEGATAAMSGRFNNQIMAQIDAQLAAAGGDVDRLVQMGQAIREQNDVWALLSGMDIPLNVGLERTVEALAAASPSVRDFTIALRELDTGMLSQDRTRIRLASGWVEIAEIWDTQVRRAEQRRLDNWRELNKVAEQSVRLTAQEILASKDLAEVKQELGPLYGNIARQMEINELRMMGLVSAAEAEQMAVLAAADAQREHDEAMRLADETARQLRREYGGEFLGALNAADEETQNFITTMMEAAIQGGANVEAIGLLAAATGDYTTEQINAALKTAAMVEKAKQLGAEVAAGNITVGEAILQWRDFQGQLEEGAVVEIDDSDIDLAIRKAERLREKFEAVARDWTATLNINVVRSGSVAPGMLPVEIPGGDIPIPVASGGVVMGGVPGRDSVPLMAMPGEVIVPRTVTADYPGGPVALFHDLTDGGGARGDGPLIGQLVINVDGPMAASPRAIAGAVGRELAKRG